MRRFGSKAVWFGLFFVYFFAITVPNAHAYLDAGTGSYVFQVLVGAGLAMAVGVKVFWRRAWALVTRKPKAAATPPEGAAAEAAKARAEASGED